MKVEGLIEIVYPKLYGVRNIQLNSFEYGAKQAGTGTEPPVSISLPDFNGIYIKFTNNLVTNQVTYVNIAGDGTFSQDNSIFDDTEKMWKYQVYKGENLILDCGTITGETLKGKLFIKIPSTLLADTSYPAIDYFIITGKIYETSGIAAITNLINYKISISYQLIDKMHDQNPLEVIAEGNANAGGDFNIKIVKNYPEIFSLNETIPFTINVSDNTNQQITVESCISDGSGEIKKENITASDLSNKSLVLKFSAFKIEMQPITINIKPPIFDLNKKIKGKVVDAAGKIKIRNNQVILYATDISPENAITKVIGVCITDSDGNFSMPYPFGQFKNASAIVSIKKDEINQITLSNKNELPDFIWIVLETLPEQMTQEDQDNCACTSTTPTLPDMEELVINSVYAQDIGGSCINFTTPNRALEEFAYYSVIRTSDPELFDCPLDKVNDRIQFVSERISSIKQALAGFTPFTGEHVDFSSFVIPADTGVIIPNPPASQEEPDNTGTSARQSKSMDIMNSSDDTSTENSIGLTDYYLSQQLPANAFLMQTIYNPNFLALQKELNILETELARLQRILEAKAEFN